MLESAAIGGNAHRAVRIKRMFALIWDNFDAAFPAVQVAIGRIRTNRAETVCAGLLG